MNDEHVQALADRLAREVLAAQLRPNTLLRYGETRNGVLAAAATLAGAAIASVGVYRRVTHIDLFGTERLYAQTVGVDRDRAHADVYYVDQRLRLLALATDDDRDELIRSAAPVLMAFVAVGRPPDQRLDEVEGAFAPLREARDDGQPTGVIVELLPAYLGAWRRALS